MGKYLDLIGLGYLIEKIQATFIKKTDTIPATSLAIDTTPTTSSNHLITSGGVKVALDTKQDTIDSSHKLSADLIQDGTTNKVYTSTEKSKLAGIASGAEVNVQVDWNVTDTSSDAYIKNKPTIPAEQIQVDWNQTDVGAKDYIKNKPELPIDYSKQYLTFEALEPCTFQFTRDIYFSIDNGLIWNLLSTNITVGIDTGDKIMWRAQLPPDSNNGIGTFSSTGNFNTEGNPLSLITKYFKTISTLPPYSFKNLFNNCSKLINAEHLSLSATILTDSCYSRMFKDCTGLITAPELPATTLAGECYGGMFYGCTSLTTTPKLPATTLAEYCYDSMFANCTSLTTAPELPAILLPQHCYEYMFNCCSNLNYIKVLANNIDYINTQSSHYWVDGVSQTGTFIKSSAANWSIGVSGIPQGWNVCTEEEYRKVKYYEELIQNDVYYKQYLTFEATEDTVFMFDSGSNQNISYSVDDGVTWSTLAAGDSTPPYSRIMWKGQLTNTGGNRHGGICIFGSSGLFNVEGNVMSLIYGDDFIGKTDLKNISNIFGGLFFRSPVVNAKNLILPSMILTENCYFGMFDSCSELITAPKILPAVILSDSCYSDMFNGCTSLTTAPELPATTLAEGCYSSMFNGCISLTIAPTLPATTLVGNCYHTMFYNCTNLAAAPELPATILAPYCYEGMFNLCSSLNYIKAMFTTTPSSSYTSEWVHRVAETGVFIKNSEAEWNVIGDNGIPEGWTVYTELDDKIVKHYELADVATTGNYNDLLNKPTIPAAQIQSDWNQTTTTAKDFIKNKPIIPDDSNLVHITGQETIQGTKWFTDFYISANGTGNIKGTVTIDDMGGNGKIILTGDNYPWSQIQSGNKTLQQALDERNNVQADWNQTTTTAADYIKNKPTIPITDYNIYAANLQVTNSANYITEPEVKSVKINGSTTNSASSNNCVLQYDTTNECLKFIFN